MADPTPHLTVPSREIFLLAWRITMTAVAIDAMSCTRVTPWPPLGGRPAAPADELVGPCWQLRVELLVA